MEFLKLKIPELKLENSRTFEN